MEVRLTFESEMWLEGKDMEEIKQKWLAMPLYSADALDSSAQWVQNLSAERTDDDSYKDVLSDLEDY